MEAMQAAAAQIDAQLPLCATATELQLIIGKEEQDSWRTDEAFRLLRRPGDDSQ
jgi:hypothetical protein